MTMISSFKAAWRVGTPIISVSTADPESCMVTLQKNCNGSAVVAWDIIRGLKDRNPPAADLLSTVGDIEESLNPVAALEMAAKFPGSANKGQVPYEGVILFMINAHRYLDRPEFVQAIWNLRDLFKAEGKMLVLLGPDFTLPAELQQDVLELDDPLPSPEELRAIVDEQIAAYIESTKHKIKISEEEKLKAVDALRGLAAFPSEQAVAMSLSKNGFDLDGLWDRKRQMINDTQALSVYAGKETFNDVGGCEIVKNFLRGVIKGKEAPRAICFIDEIEKQFSGASSDFVGDGGVARDSLSITLQYMEDHESDGCIFVGPPGAAKSLVAKALGNEAAIPTIILDLGGARGGIVGESESRIRNAYKIIDAIGAGNVFFIATCNKIATLPPELKRRYTSGIFFFTLPDDDSAYRDRTERDLIWPIYVKKYNLDSSQVKDVDDSGWTGAEIRNCCRMAYRQNLGLKEAAQYIVPVSKSAPEQIEQLRREASGRYLSANRPGVYQLPASNGQQPKTTRKFQPEVN